MVVVEMEMEIDPNNSKQFMYLDTIRYHKYLYNLQWVPAKIVSNKKIDLEQKYLELVWNDFSHLACRNNLDNFWSRILARHYQYRVLCHPMPSITHYRCLPSSIAARRRRYYY